MGPDNNTVSVFPISAGAFGLRADFLSTASARMTGPAYLLMTLVLVISVGIMALKRFENGDFIKKAWNIPVIITAVAFWPYIVLGLKDLVETFNTFLVYDVFRIPWRGFGFPPMTASSSMFGWSMEAAARLLPIFAYWIIYAFYIITFCFYALLGPLIMAKGILTDEVEGFLELVKELVLLLLWQTTLVMLVAIIMPDIVSGEPFPARSANQLAFLSVILAVLILFIPALSRKFGGHLGSSFVPLGFRFGGAAIGFSMLGGVGGAAMASAGLPLKEGGMLVGLAERASKAEEFKARYEHNKHAQDHEVEIHHLEEHVQEHSQEEHHEQHEAAHEAEEGHAQGHDLVDLAQHAHHEQEPEH